MKAPNFPLSVVRVEDTAFSENNICYNAYQFAYRYVYKDGQRSVLSPYSKHSAAEPNSSNNYIRLNFSISEPIPTFTKDVEIYFKENKSDTWILFIVEDVNTVISQEVKFYNNTLGVALQSAQASKYFESIPLKSKTLEVAKGRLFLGQNSEGYGNTLVDIAFNVQTATSSSTTQSPIYLFKCSQGHWEDGEWFWDGDIRYDYYYLHNSLYYQIMISETEITDFTSVQSSTYQPDIGYTQNQIQLGGVTQAWWPYPNPLSWQAPILISSYTVDVGVNNILGRLKSRSSYKMGIVFYDKYNRNGGVLTKDDWVVNIPDQTSSNPNKEVSWTINTSNSTIPDWATSYQIVRTKNSRCSSFIHYKTNDVLYNTGVNDDGKLMFGYWSPQVKAIYVDINSISETEIGYTYQQGDLLDIYIVGEWVTLEVTGQDSQYIVCKAQNIGTSINPDPSQLSSYQEELYFEVYSPVKKSINELFYEVGNNYPIHSSSGVNSFSVTSGILNGDTYLITRNWLQYDDDYYIDTTGSEPADWTVYNTDLVNQQSISVEVMNPYEEDWFIWLDNTGRVNIELEDEGVQEKQGNIRFSNTVILGTKNNGAHEFEIFNEAFVPAENGVIQKLMFTSGVEGEGKVMLAICQNETTSMYLGQSQLVDEVGNAVLAISNSVIGTMRTLKGGYGTLNPESVKEVDGSVFWWDLRNATLVRYNVNGLFPISDYKMKTYFREKAKSIKDLNLIGMYGFGGIDKGNDEYILSFAYYGGVIITGFSSTWSNLVCTTVQSGVTTGAYRMKTLTVSKYLEFQLLTGYPVSYNVTDAFTFGTTSYSAISDSDFAALSTLDYPLRVIAFYNYVEELISGFDFPTTVTNASDGTNTLLCPIYDIDSGYTGYSATWSNLLCKTEYGAFTGVYRMKTLTVSKYSNSNMISGYPVSYNITNAFTGNSISYSAISDSDFKALSTLDYALRGVAFYNYVEGLESSFDSSTEVENSPSGTDTNACPYNP
jgi:hypothetical protein